MHTRRHRQGLRFLAPTALTLLALLAATGNAAAGPLDRTGWVASASSSAAGDPPSRAIDSSRETRWSSGAAQAPGQTFELGFGNRRSFDRILLDSGSLSFEDDHPRAYEVHVSDDGALWRGPIASGTGSGPLTDIRFPLQEASGIRITQTGADSFRWWSIHDLQVYGPDGGPRSGWRKVATTGPSARAIHAGAFDARRSRAVIFGGAAGDWRNDVWAFSLADERWRPVVTSGEGPSPRFAPAVVADPARDRVVVFFGFDGTSSSEVWALDFETRMWSRLPSGPSPRFDASAARDGDRVWILGGFADFSTSLSDLWEFDLATSQWRELPARGVVPPPRTNHALGYHAGALYTVGGHDEDSLLRDTWRYDLAAGTWKELAPAGTLAAWAHFGYATVVDRACGTLLMMGGDNNDRFRSPFLQGLQLAGESRFVELTGAEATLARDHAVMVLDPSSRRLVLFGGRQGPNETLLSDTWVYDLGGCP